MSTLVQIEAIPHSIINTHMTMTVGPVEENN